MANAAGVANAAGDAGAAGLGSAAGNAGTAAASGSGGQGGGLAAPDAGRSPGDLPPGPKQVLVIAGDNQLGDPSRMSFIEVLDGMSDSHELSYEISESPDSIRAVDLGDTELIIISANAGACGGQLDDSGLDTIAVPVIVSKDCTNFMKIATMHNTDNSSLDSITIVNAEHPLAAGLPLGEVRVFQAGARLVRGSDLGPDVIKIATTPEEPETSWGIFAYEQGGKMPGDVPAPAKRVGFFWHRDKAGTAEGKLLLQAAIDWALRL